MGRVNTKCTQKKYLAACPPAKKMMWHGGKDEELPAFDGTKKRRREVKRQKCAPSFKSKTGVGNRMGAAQHQNPKGHAAGIEGQGSSKKRSKQKETLERLRNTKEGVGTAWTSPL